MHTYAHTCIHARKHANIRTYKSTNKHTYKTRALNRDAYIHTYIHAHKHENIRTYKPTNMGKLHTETPTYMHTCIYVSMHAYEHAEAPHRNIPVCMLLLLLHTFIYQNMHTHVHTCLRAYKHANIRTYKPVTSHRDSDIPLCSFCTHSSTMHDCMYVCMYVCRHTFVLLLHTFIYHARLYVCM
jgi:hypothetical protein